MTRRAARDTKPKRIRLPLKKETAIRLTQLQAELEQTSANANAVVEAARQRVADALMIVCSEGGIDPAKAKAVEVTNAEPFELVLDVTG